MALVQDAAYELFADRAFGDVAVTDIANRAGVAPATVYRHFGTKERILTWNEHDDEIASLVRRRIHQLPPLAALRMAFLTDLAPLIDNERQRRQMRLIYGDPALTAAVTMLDAELIPIVAAEIAAANTELAPVEVDVIVRAGMGALEAAFLHWQGSGNATPLAEIVEQAFNTLAEMTSPTDWGQLSS
jgi:AcrR family transcriptional regulator